MKRSDISSPRREFIKKISAASLGMMSIPLIATDDKQQLKDLPPNTVILFQGDSITDAGRDRGRYYANETPGLGNGYVYQVLAEILGSNPGKNLKCYNRGISGNKVYQLADRWDDDCLNLKPNILSILIGVNDFWHTLSGNYPATVKTFEDDLRKLLDRTVKALPGIKLILGEPFAVKGGTAINEKWSDFPPYQEAVRKIAADYKAYLVPCQKIFDDALESAPASYWCPDGVHPSIAGAYLMKNAWLQAI
jgi:lysophospholipase L1-like esterase